MSIRKQFLSLSYFTALQSAVRLLVNFILGKLAAIFLGPAGLAVVGNFQNIANMAQQFSNGAIQNGLIKYLAEKPDNERQKKLIQTSYAISVLVSLLLAIGIFIFYPYLNKKFIGLAEPFLPFLFLSLSLVFYALGLLISAIFNGVKNYKHLAYFNIFQSLANIILFVPFIYFFQLQGALIALVLFPIISLVFSYFYFQKKYQFYFQNFKWNWDKKIVKDLSGFSIMTLVTIFTTSFTLLWVRTFIIQHIDAQHAGYWEGLNRISNFYIYFFALIFSSFILPKFAEAKSVPVLVQQIKQNIIFVGGLALLILPLVYLCKRWLIPFIFTNAFLPMQQYLPFHLLGDFVKIIAWIFVNYLVAQKFIKYFIISDLLFNLSFILMVQFWALNLNDLTFYYFLSTVVYLVILLLVTFLSLNKISNQVEKI